MTTTAKQAPYCHVPQVRQEANEAYMDCWSKIGLDITLQRRRLMWRASEAIHPNDAAGIMAFATGGGYNAFDPKCLCQLGNGARVTLAREYSVCVYVEGVEFDSLWAAEHMHIDSYKRMPDGSIRLWWD